MIVCCFHRNTKQNKHIMWAECTAFDEKNLATLNLITHLLINEVDKVDKQKLTNVLRILAVSLKLQYSISLPPIRCYNSPFFILYWRYNSLWVCILQPSSGAIASSRMRFLDHTQRRTRVGRTPLDEWSARRRDLYLTTRIILTTDKRPFPQWDSNTQSQQASGRRPTT